MQDAEVKWQARSPPTVFTGFGVSREVFSEPSKTSLSAHRKYLCLFYAIKYQSAYRSFPLVECLLNFDDKAAF